MSAGRTSHRGARRARPPDRDETVEEALQRALAHARGAAAEGLSAARALLDAASIALFDAPARIDRDAHTEWPPLRLALDSGARGLDELIRLAGAGHGGLPDALLSTILDALDDEVDRWETRSHGDAEARAVLRAFLGVREILWEVGVRRPDKKAGEHSAHHEPERRRARAETAVPCARAPGRRAGAPGRRAGNEGQGA